MRAEGKGPGPIWGCRRDGGGGGGGGDFKKRRKDGIFEGREVGI